MLLRLLQVTNGVSLPIYKGLEKNARLYAERLTYWPQTIDYRSLPADMAIRIAESKESFTYHYSGDTLGGNRVLCSDMHFPLAAMGTSEDWTIKPEYKSELITSSFPFTKICNDNGILTTRLSCVAYFELSIHEIPKYVQERNDSNRMRTERFNRRPCVSIGLVSPNSSLSGRMPGWDMSSYGDASI